LHHLYKRVAWHISYLLNFTCNACLFIIHRKLLFFYSQKYLSSRQFNIFFNLTMRIDIKNPESSSFL
jgi:hypothetical protein